MWKKRTIIKQRRPITTFEERKQYKAEWAKKNPQVKTQEQKQKNYDWKKVKITCECGINISRGGLSRHFKSLKHKEFIKV